MPILTQHELATYLPQAIAQALSQDAGGFAACEQATAAEIVTRTGITEPAAGDESQAPVWAKECAAYLILYKRLGVLGKIDPEVRAWAEGLAKAATTTLAAHRIGTSTGRTASSTTGTIEGLKTW